MTTEQAFADLKRVSVALIDEMGAAAFVEMILSATAQVERDLEFLRSVAGAVTDGDSFADIRKAIKHSG